jgi:flavin-dependent dehydrogenase
VAQRYDVAITGGGPAGSAAAWQAAQTGARVVLLDKAEFPRDKPCGDGLTPRAVGYLQKMGLAGEVAKFHRVNRAKVFSPREWELSFPHRPGMPDHGHVARRLELDVLLLKTLSRRAQRCASPRRSSVPSLTTMAASPA